MNLRSVGILLLALFGVACLSPGVPSAAGVETVTPAIASAAVLASTTPVSPAEAAQAEPGTMYLALIMRQEAPSPTPITDPGSAILADHRAVDQFEQIPLNYINAAAALDVLFMHQSTGENIEFLGLECLAGNHGDPSMYPQECVTYAAGSPFDRSKWDWSMWPEPMADGRAKTDQFVSLVPNRQQEFDVMGMKFCYVDNWNQDFDYYREKMEQLQRDYPQKTFIWATQGLWSESEVAGNPSDNIQVFNRQLREYARTHDIYLYDIAAIESTDLNGNTCQVGGYEALCNEYYDGFGGGGGGHPDVEGSLRLAKGFWWLMARIAGWEGTLAANQ